MGDVHINHRNIPKIYLNGDEEHVYFWKGTGQPSQIKVKEMRAITSTNESNHLVTMAIVSFVIGFILSKLKLYSYLSMFFIKIKSVFVWKKETVVVSPKFSSIVQGKIDIINRKRRSSETKSKTTPVIGS